MSTKFDSAKPATGALLDRAIQMHNERLLIEKTLPPLMSQEKVDLKVTKPTGITTRAMRWIGLRRT